MKVHLKVYIYACSIYVLIRVNVNKKNEVIFRRIVTAVGLDCCPCGIYLLSLTHSLAWHANHNGCPAVLSCSMCVVGFVCVWVVERFWMTFEAALLQKSTDSWTACWRVLCGCWAWFCMLSRPCDLGHVQRDHHGGKQWLAILNTQREQCFLLFLVLFIHTT